MATAIDQGVGGAAIQRSVDILCVLVCGFFGGRECSGVGGRDRAGLCHCEIIGIADYTDAVGMTQNGEYNY
jgi:hypothetical protein